MSPDTTDLPIEGELTIATVAEWKPRLLAALEPAAAVAVDLSGITQLDGAGLQLLLLLGREARRREVALDFHGPSRAVSAVLALARLEHLLHPAGSTGCCGLCALDAEAA